MAKYCDIAIIGSGNVAWHLAPELENVGHRVLEVYGRNAKNARLLQRRLYNAEINPSLDFSESAAEVFILCVSDDAIESVVGEIVLPEDAAILHTSGSQPLEVLDHAGTEHFGVLYPLQTFSKEKKISFDDLPILIEGSTRHAEMALKMLSKSMSKKVIRANSQERMAAHVAAVFACNFTNHLFVVAQEILKNHDLSFKLLEPLIVETINKSLAIGPQNAQTGPAARHDLEILDRHLEFLKDSGHQGLYQLITEKILNA